MCFCEAKVLSDCSTSVANDLARNQLARVIENLLTFQRSGSMPRGLRFSLLTPCLPRDEATRSRLYEPRWQYPPHAPRLDILRIHWATYEVVFSLDDGLRTIDVADVARRGELPDVVAQRIEDAAKRLRTTAE